MLNAMRIGAFLVIQIMWLSSARAGSFGYQTDLNKTRIMSTLESLAFRVDTFIIYTDSDRS